MKKDYLANNPVVFSYSYCWDVVDYCVILLLGYVNRMIRSRIFGQAESENDTHAGGTMTPVPCADTRRSGKIPRPFGDDEQHPITPDNNKKKRFLWHPNYFKIESSGYSIELKSFFSHLIREGRCCQLAKI